MVTYLEASAWVKRYLAETGSARVEQLFAEDRRLATATFGLIEILAALARAQRAGKIDDRSYRKGTANAIADFGRFTVVDFTREVFALARDAAGTYALRAGDTMHLASATALRETHQEPVCIVTADRELATAARLARFEVLDPTDA